MNEAFHIAFLELDNGRSPFLEWEQKLDRSIRNAIRNRIRLGNLGDCKSITGVRGLHELRLHIGPGYRIYFGKDRERLVLLLCGGMKKSQDRDIAKAKQYWDMYKRDKNS